MTTKLKQTDGECIMTLSEDLTVEHADEMRSNLIKAIIDNDRISVRFEDIRSIDLTCLQLLCSAHRSAVRMKKEVFLSGITPDLFLKTIQNAGYARFSGCQLGTGSNCLWTSKAS